MAPEIIDAWMQHPSREFLDQPMFDSLRKWTHGTFAPGDLPLEWTIKAMDEARVRLGMLCAWWAPSRPTIAGITAVWRVTSDRGPARSRKTLDAFSRSRREEKCARER